MALTTSLDGYYKLQSDGTDSVGTIGTISGTTPTYTTGKIDNGGSFASTSSQYLESAAFVGGTSWSFSFWWKGTSFPTNNVPICRDLVSGTSRCWALVGSATDITLYGWNDSATLYNTTTTAHGMSTGVWYHWAGHWSVADNKMRLYKNGILFAEVTTTGNAEQSSVKLSIGRHGDATSYVNSVLDEIGIWSKALTADEISQLYNSGRANAYPLTDTPSLYGGVAYYKLDSGALTTDTVGGFTLTNNNTVGTGTGFIGTGSADFGTTNTNKYLNVTNDMGTDGGAVSISIWVKMRTEISSGSQGFCIHGGATSHVNDMIGYDYNGGTRRLAWNRQQQNTANNVYYYTATLGTTDWHHLVYTYDGTTMKGYYDGTEVVSQALSGTGASGTGDGFGLGNTNIGGGNEWYTSSSCYIDEVGVWTRAITGAEVTSLYNGGAGLAYPFTVSTYTGAGFMALKRR